MSATPSVRLRSFQAKYFPSEQLSSAEYNLVQVLEGAGKCFVGSMGMKDVKAGDLFLIAPQTEVVFLSDSVYFGNNDLQSSWNILSFPEKVLPVNYKVMPEFADIYALLRMSRMGLLFSGDSFLEEDVFDLLDPFPMQTPLAQTLTLYRVLKRLSSGSGATVAPRRGDAAGLESQLPISRTYSYLIRNLREEVKLSDVAEYAGQNRSALCRRFKAETGQSILACLQEMRLSQAARLLVESGLPTAQIATECGFGSLNQFNRQFKTRMGISPAGYRERFQQR